MILPTIAGPSAPPRSPAIARSANIAVPPVDILPEQVKTISENACIPGETIHNLAGDVQPVELYDAIMQADAMGKIALGK